MNLNDIEQYEAWFRIEYGQEPMPRTSPTHDFCWAGYKAGQESMRQQLAEREKQVTLLREAMQGAWKDGYCFVGPEGQTDEQKAFEQALAATTPKET